MGFSQFLLHLRVLLWKNALLKCRYWVVLFLEIIIPTAIIVALSGVKYAIKPTDIPVNLPASYHYSQSLDEMYQYYQCNGENLVMRCAQEKYTSTCPGKCEPRKIAVAPKYASSTSAAQAAADFTLWATQSSVYAQNYSTFALFNSEQEFLDLIDSSMYSIEGSIYSCAVIFDEGYPTWEYTLRMNKTYVIYGNDNDNPPTSTPNLDISLHANDETGDNLAFPYNQAYINTGVVTLMDKVNSFVATYSCRQNGCSSNENVTIHTVGSADFPNPKARTTGFWGAVGSVFALLMIISLLYPLANVIKALVAEKETKLREGMLMMALRGDSLWVSWGLHFVFLFLPLSIILTVAGGGLFTYSSSIFVFFYFFVFFISSTSYCILVSVFFSKARTASIVGCMVFFVGFFIFVGLESSNPTRGTILTACLHPATAFTYGTLAFSEYEDAQIGVTANTWNVSSTYNVTFQDTLNMMFIDMIYMGVLAWYFDNIWPSEFGTHKPWYFIFLPSYWFNCIKSWVCCCFTFNATKYNRVSSSQNDGIEMVNNSAIEEVPETLSAQVEGKSCIDIQNLYKSFQTNTGVKVAVDHLNLTMYSGQITALLGHNGAGKSTTIAMLTGLIPPESGSAIIEGWDINSDMDEIRKNLGVCPQHDILFPDMTVEEHLIMFASFKNTPKDKLNAEVEKMIQSVGLTEKRKVFSKHLSGGQKRKLSVAIAFIGGSRVVFLDEPTSGMDPYSRRFTWNVIRQYREGRVIVLTTHFMDEADLLGDRIAIMGDGKLRCCGSSLFLKRTFGVGYNMTIEKKGAVGFKGAQMEELVASHVPEAKLLTDVGTEMTFQLPFSSSNRFPILFQQMDDSLDQLGIQSYGMSVTTLEEVFIRVAQGTHTQADAEAGRSRLKSTSPRPEETQKPSNVQSPDLESNDKSGRMPVMDFEKISDDSWALYFMRHIYAMLVKRFLYFIRDTKAWIFTYVIPVLFLLAGMLIMRFTYPDTYQPNKALVPSMYNPGITSDRLPTPFTAANTFCNPKNVWTNDDDNLQVGTCWSPSMQSSIVGNISEVSTFPATPLTDAISIKNVSNYLYDHRKDYQAAQFGAFSILQTLYNGNRLNNIEYVVHSNYTALHGLPLFTSLFADGITRMLNPSTTVTVNLHPLPPTKKQNKFYSNYNVDLVVTFLLLAIPYLPAAFATYIVREREVKAKYQQLVSGVSVPAYWIATWLWDNFSMQFTIFMFIILIASFPDTENLSSVSSGALGCVFGLLILFGMSVTGFTYLCSFLFQSPAGAQVTMIFGVFVLGLVLSIVGIVLRIIPSTNEIYMSTIRYIFCLFPPFALAEGLHNLAVIDVWSFLELSGTEKYDVHHWNITGANFMMMGWETVAYLGLTILYEYVSLIPSIQALTSGHSNHLPETKQELKDEDVIAEERRIASGESHDTVVVNDIKKMYPGGKFAVRGVSLGIPNGECFGLLGINGAGKSTTLAMLSGELQPSTGAIHLAGRNLLEDVHACRRQIGFCPQFDALFELLTGREHLQLYARIKGIAEKDIPRVVDGKIAEMGLTEYADRAAGTYSGGNKRKLSVAIAMIGEPSIIFLDEPSTGMDPVARRFMWEVISDIVTKREKCSMILTTHSMEECEALCTRIGVMVGGVLRCLGSAQRLRNRYGLGYQIEIGMGLPTTDDVNQQSALIYPLFGQQPPQSPGSDSDLQLSRDDVLRVFTALGRDRWAELLNRHSSGSDLQASFETNGFVGCRHLASWCVLEETFDRISGFLNNTFGSYTLRERQIAKVRVEVPSVHPNDNSKRKLSSMFAAVEAARTELRIQEYSISQTSLEQIFNYFASQQEEETGNAAGIVDSK